MDTRDLILPSGLIRLTIKPEFPVVGQRQVSGTGRDKREIELVLLREPYESIVYITSPVFLPTGSVVLALLQIVLEGEPMIINTVHDEERCSRHTTRYRYTMPDPSPPLSHTLGA